jgi:hypothetical protein
MDNEEEILVNSFLSQVAELKTADSNKLIRGDAQTLEKYNFLVGRIKAFSECESIISDLLKQSE